MHDIHDVKSWSYLFDAIVEGRKTADIRDMRERDYKVGDNLVLRRFDQTTGEYTGEKCLALITHMISRNTPCAFSSSVLDPDYAILSLKVIT